MSIELVSPAPGAAHSDFLPPPFACSCTRCGPDAARVRVCGELDMATTPELERALDEYRARLVVLDLRELAFIDGRGLRTIITAGARARQAGRRLVLVRVPANVKRMLALVGSSDQVEIADHNPLPRPAREVQRTRVARSLLVARHREAAH